MRYIVVLFLVAFAVPAWASVRAGSDAYERGDYAEAVRWYREAAEQGLADAAFRLGFMYDSGNSYVLWMREQFHDQEAFYNAGRDVPQNDAEALKWFHMAAEQGHALAQYYLDVMYVDDKGVPRDDVQAHRRRQNRDRLTRSAELSPRANFAPPQGTRATPLMRIIKTHPTSRGRTRRT